MTHRPDEPADEPTQPLQQRPPVPPPPPPPPYVNPAGPPPTYPLPSATVPSAPWTGGWPGGPVVSAAAPFGIHQASGRPFSDKTKTTAGLLQLLLPLVGVCGVGRLYTGHVAIGLVQLIGFFVAAFFSLLIIGLPFLVGIWLWSVIDGIVTLASASTDATGRVLR